MKHRLFSAHPLGLGPAEDEGSVVPVDASRITGFADSPAEARRGPAACDIAGAAADAAPPPATRVGELVRLRPSARFGSPWRDYAERGTLMRVRAVDRARGRRCVCVQPADAGSRSLRHDWFEQADIEPLDEATPADLRARWLALHMAAREAGG